MAREKAFALAAGIPFMTSPAPADGAIPVYQYPK
jgi:hypothetical protein